MTRFHVDLGATRIEEPQPEHQFAKFKSLKKAVRWAKQEHDNGRFDQLPEILNDAGDPISIDWDGPEWLHRDELISRLASAETSRQHAHARAAKLEEEQARRDNEMIKAGYIPIRALAPHLVGMERRHEGGVGAFSPVFPREFGLPTEITWTLELRQFAPRVGAAIHPFVTAMTALSETRRNR